MAPATIAMSQHLSYMDLRGWSELVAFQEACLHWSLQERLVLSSRCHYPERIDHCGSDEEEAKIYSFLCPEIHLKSNLTCCLMLLPSSRITLRTHFHVLEEWKKQFVLFSSN